MSINLGNKKFKKLYKGDELIIQMYKGDEKIFEDFEAIYGFKFTIDTRLTTSDTPNANDATLSLPFLKNYPKYGKVLWGDGTEDTYNDTTSGTHTYPAPGVYQVTLVPTRFYNGEVMKGWLCGAPYGQNHKVVSIDTPFPIRSLRINIDGPESQTDGYARKNMKNYLQQFYHLESVPADLFKNVEIVNKVNPSTSAFKEFFSGTFFGAGKWVSNGLDIYTPAKVLFDKMDYSKATDLTGLFASTFRNTQLGCCPLPEGLFTVNAPLCTNFSKMFYQTFDTNGWSNNITAWDIDLSGDIFQLDTSAGTNFSEMFSATFYRPNYTFPATFTISEDLFSTLDTSNGTNFGSMFSSCFSSTGSKSTTMEIPEKLFWGLNTSNGTNFSGMFTSTFYEFGKMTKPMVIPEELFSHLDTSNGTDFSSMFAATLYGLGYNDNITTTIPEDLFDIDTSNGTNFSGMFSSCFSNTYRNNSVCVVPSLFKHLNTSNGINFSSMFAQTFHWGLYSGAHEIASDLFSCLNTQNGVNFSSMFSNTFDSVKFKDGAFPATFFDINTSNGTNFSSMFKGCFNWGNMKMTNLPAGLFSMDTSNGTNFSNMFNSTFYHCSTGSSSSLVSTPIPKLFAIDTSSGTDFRNMFSGTFGGVGYPSYRFNSVSIPADLFGTIVTTSGTDFTSMFSSTFSVCIDELPAGLFGGLTISPTATVTSMFDRTFSISNPAASSSDYYDADLYDIFQGMSDFSWATAANASSVFNGMFNTQNGGGTKLVGSASTILQHFNFIPNADTNMFYNQVNLTDYATIDNNWK